MNFGEQIKFIDSSDTTFPFDEVPRNTTGVIQYVMGNEIGVIWDNGASVILNKDTDEYQLLGEEE